MEEIAQLLRDQNKLMTEMLELNKKSVWHLSQSRSLLDSVRIELSRGTTTAVSDYLEERQLSMISSLDVARSGRVNLSRFGDGEIKLMCNADYNLAFQKNSPELRAALVDVFAVAKSSPDRLMLGMVPMIHTQFWTQFFTEYWHQAEPFFRGLERLANSHMSRPKMFLDHGQEAVDSWRKVWDMQDVVVVTGRGSRFELEPALFNNAKSIAFEESLPRDAFADLPRLADKLTFGKQDLVLVSLGPAGSILPSMLAPQGTWAMDIGHLSSSYAQVFSGASAPEKAPISR